MPLPSWPATVPYKPRRGEWSMPEPYIEPLATDMDGGNKRLRSKPGSNVAVIEQTLRMTADAFDDFNAFVRGDLNNGTSRFTAQVWLGSAYATKTCQFEGAPKPGDGGRKKAVTMKIRIFGM